MLTLTVQVIRAYNNTIYCEIHVIAGVDSAINVTKLVAMKFFDSNNLDSQRGSSYISSTLPSLR